MKRQLLTLIIALVAGVASFAKGWTPLTQGEAVAVATGETNWSVAADDAPDYPALQVGEVFTIKNFGDDVWTFTSAEGGMVKIVGDNGDGDWIGGCLLVYDDADMTHEVHNYVNNTYYEFLAEAGHIYYIKNWNWTGQDFKGHVAMGTAQFAMTGSDPADNGMFFITSDNSATLTFTSSVTFTDGELTANGNVVKIYNFTDYNDLVANGIFTYTEEGTSGIVDWNGNICARDEGNTIVVSFTSATGRGYFNVVNKLLDEGKLKTGDQMTLTMHGVRSSHTGELLNGDGNLTLTWYSAGAPTTLVSASVPETLLSWYNEGDANGVATFTFSKDIKSAMAILEMGNGEAQDLYTEYIAADHITFDGPTVKVDLSGVMRTLATMGLQMNWGQFSFMLTQVVDADGNFTFSEDLGSASTYTYMMRYADISKTLSYDITPATGSVLTADNKEVEIWFNEDGLIEFDGVTVTYYTTETIVETITETVYNEDTGEWEELTRDVETEQNIAHETFVKFDDLKIVADPTGTTITCALPEGIHEAKNVCVKLNVTVSTDGQPHVVAAYYNTQVMYGLPVEQCADPVSETTVSRLSEIYLPLGFVYSINDKVANPVIVTSKTNPQFTARGTVVADGMVQAKIVLDEPISDEGQYTVTVAEGVIGDYVYGESGFNSGTTHEAFNLYYSVDGKYAGKSVVCEPNDGETVASLSQFTITFFDYNTVAPSWDNEKCPYVSDADGKEYPGSFVEGMEVSNSVVFVLDQPITDEGVYVFNLTGGSVANGATGDPITTTYTFTYTVDGSYVPPVAGKPVLNPAEGTVDEIGNILIDFGQPVTLVEASPANDWWVPQPTLISTDDGATLFASGQLAATGDPNVVEWTNWAGTAVKACDAVFSIPAGCVQFADGATNAEFSYTYTITGANDIVLSVVATTPEQWGYVDELSEMTVTFDQPVEVGEWAAAIANDAFWTQEVMGTVTATDDPKTVKVTFAEPIKEFGETAIRISAYSLVVGGRAYDQDIYLNVTVGENNGGSQGGNDDPVDEENVTITPGSDAPLASLKYFEITFGGYAGAWNEKPIKLKDAYDNDVATVGAYHMSGESQDGTWFWELGKNNTYSITLLNEVTEAGFYTLVVPVVCEKQDGSTVNREFYFTFEVDPAVGVKAVKAGVAGDAIYTLDGIRVNSPRSTGIYIVGGRKVLIRK